MHVVGMATAHPLTNLTLHLIYVALPTSCARPPPTHRHSYIHAHTYSTEVDTLSPLLQFLSVHNLKSWIELRLRMEDGPDNLRHRYTICFLQ